MERPKEIRFISALDGSDLGFVIELPPVPPIPDGWFDDVEVEAEDPAEGKR